jgi:bone morphogenetic protein receptor type-2
MAPEMLEGRINLNDITTQLKQIDIYALGTVLWEISSRCADVCSGRYF